jgi:hypothetical protein
MMVERIGNQFTAYDDEKITAGACSIYRTDGETDAQRVFRAYSAEIQDYSVRWSVIAKMHAPRHGYRHATGHQEGLTT